jgi:hypothetical protein
MSALASVSEDQLFETLRESLLDPKGRRVLFSLPPGGLRSQPSGVLPGEAHLEPGLAEALKKDPSAGLQLLQIEAKKPRGAKLAEAILEQYYRPVHAVLCKPATTEGVSASAAIAAQITALSHFLQISLGLDPITAFAIAAIVATVVIRLFQGAFCALSEHVVLPKLKAMVGGEAV